MHKAKRSTRNAHAIGVKSEQTSKIYPAPVCKWLGSNWFFTKFINAANSFGSTSFKKWIGSQTWSELQISRIKKCCQIERSISNVWRGTFDTSKVIWYIYRDEQTKSDLVQDKVNQWKTYIGQIRKPGEHYPCKALAAKPRDLSLAIFEKFFRLDGHRECFLLHHQDIIWRTKLGTFSTVGQNWGVEVKDPKRDAETIYY